MKRERLKLDKRGEVTDRVEYKELLEGTVP